MVVQFFLLQENVQYERVAGIADTVQRELGMLPQQANLRRLHRRGKSRKLVNLYRFTLLANLSLHKYFLLFLKLFTKISEKIS